MNNTNYMNDDKLASDDVVVIKDSDAAGIVDLTLDDDAPSPGDEDKQGNLTDDQKLAAAEETRLTARAEELGKTVDEVKALEVDEKTANDQKAIDEENIRKEKELSDKIQANILKELGFESIDDIKKLKEPPVQETAEQQQVREQKETAAMQSFLVDKDKMTLNEINTFTNLKALDPVKVVFSDFSNQYREENKDRKNDKDEADPVTDEEVQDAFDEAFHTKATSPTLKKIGENAIKRHADDLVAPLEKKYEEGKKEFLAGQQRLKLMPEFKTFVQTTLKTAIPEKYEFECEDGRKISVDLDGKDFEEIEKKFKNDQVYDNYYRNTDRKGLSADMVEEVDRQLAKKYMASAVKLAEKLGYEAGQKSKVTGVKASFDENGEKTPAAQVTTKGLSEKEKAQLRQDYGR